MKKIGLFTLFVIIHLITHAQSNVLVIDYNNNFSSDQQNNASRIYNRLLATQASVIRVNAIPATINTATYNQVWIFGDMGIPSPATLNPIINYINAGGAVYVQSEVSCCNNEASFADQLINATTLAGGAITHNVTISNLYQYQPSTTLACTPWVNHGAALRPFAGTPANNILFATNNGCPAVPASVVGVKFASCDMISGQGALIVNGDFNIFPIAGTCGAVGIMGTVNNNTVIDLIANLFPTLVVCGNPNPSSVTMATPTNVTVCNGATVPASAYTSTPAGATFAWTNTNAAIGLAASGSGNTPAFTAVNMGTTPITSTITVTPSIGCPGQSVNYTITVNPSTIVNPITNITVCNGAIVPASTFTSTPAGATFAWTNSNAAIGLAANGTGNTPAFTAVNMGTTPITSTVSITPTLNGCVGVPVNYTITVNPSPIVNPITNITVCNGAIVPASTFTSTPAGATFAWTNTNAAIGLAASGTGNTPVFTAVNMGTTPITSTITVTPSIGCPGQSVNYTITVNPSTIVNPITNITVCNGATVPASTFTSTPAGATFAWTNSNAAIGLAASGTGNTPAFTAVNMGTTPITSTVSVTPTLNGCVGVPINYTITVNPSTIVNPITNITVCNGATVPASTFTSTPAGATFAWTNSNTTIGLAASGSGNTPAFTTVNMGTTPITSTVSITPTLNGCVGVPVNYTITVNPSPIVNPITNITVCNGAIVPASAYTSTPIGATFAWTNSNTTIGLAASGSGNTPAFTTVNMGTTPITSTVSITPTLNGCVGVPVNYTITVNPSTIVNPITNITVCNGAIVPASAYTSTPIGATFAWTNSNTTIGLAASGSGNTPAFTTVNMGTTPITSTVSVTPTLNGCVGVPVNYTIIVTPSPSIPTVANPTICPNNTATLVATAPGGNYEWYDAAVGGNLLSTTPSFTTPNLTATTTYYVQTNINGCLSAMAAVVVTVNPNLIVSAGLDQTICFGANANLSVSPNGVGFSYTWLEVGNPTPFSSVFNPVVSPTVTTSYVVTVIDPNTCVGNDTVQVIVNPALLNTLTPTNVTCNGACDGSILSAPVGGTPPYTYMWSNGATTASINNLCPGSYDVLITDALGCTVFTTTAITEPAALQLNLAASINPLCNASCDGSITVSSSGGTGVHEYSINGINFQPSATFSNQCAGNYMITVRDANLCTQTLNVVLNNPSALTITTISSIDVSCNQANNGVKNDGSISIVAAGGTPPYSYSIDNGVTFSSLSIINGLTIGVYTIVVNDANGCSINGGVININEPTPITLPTVVIDVNCFGGSDGQVVVAPQGGTPAYTYAWSNGNGNLPVASNLPAGNITATITDANGCSQSITENITQPNPINISFISSVQNGCSPLSVVFTNTTDTNLITNLLWNFGNGVVDTNNIDTTLFTTPGSYDVSLTVTDNIGCVGTLTKTAYITVYENPIANFSFSPGNATIFDPTIFFTDLSQFNIVNWNWSFDSLGNSIMQHPSFVFPGNDTATYLVNLMVVDNNGCVDSITKPVKIFGESGVFVPNAFTPDGDDLNEFFAPKGFGIIAKDYSFLIFDRWGEIIFESYQLDVGWDGAYKGTLVPVGVYVWKLDYKDVNNKKHSKTGKVTIVR